MELLAPKRKGVKWRGLGVKHRDATRSTRPKVQESPSLRPSTFFPANAFALIDIHLFLACHCHQQLDYDVATLSGIYFECQLILTLSLARFCSIIFT